MLTKPDSVLLPQHNPLGWDVYSSGNVKYKSYFPEIKDNAIFSWHATCHFSYKAMDMQRILVADDEYDIVTLVSILLKSAGYLVTTTTELTSISDCLEKTRPDLLLMDVNMPPFDGRNVCKKIKADHAHDLPVVLFSANMLSQESIAASGADAFISKPFTLDGLLSVVKRALA